MAMETGNSAHLIRSEVWSSQLKEVLEDELQATTYVNWMSDFPDGDTFTIPSIGQAVTDNYSENSAVKYRALDTGEFQFSIDQYKSSGHYITNKAKQFLYEPADLFIRTEASLCNLRSSRS